LIVGTVVAVVWANVHLPSYDRIAHPLHFWVNDIGMAFFFALAAKEVFEAMLPGGALASVRRAVPPLAAAVGGMAMPATIFIALAAALGPAELVRGWAIPCATDIAFSSMVARAIFPRGHPAIPFLLVLAIADDALGLIILAVFYPASRILFAVPAVAMASALLLAWWLGRRGVRSFWPYVLVDG
jgi:NhaA family Na+:H+ antiporter